ncbi:MAG: hypothetical protein K5873_00840 [Treponema sp.]|nr:hypothetical protein [Treponema sp.]
MLKKITALLFLLSLFFSLSAGDFTEKENSMIQEILSFRLSLRALPDSESCISSVQDFRSSHEEEILSFSEEASLVCMNMLASAEYNAAYEKDMHDTRMEGILRPQYEKLTAFSEGKSAGELNPWFIMTSADLTNSMMQFLKQSEAIKKGLQEKKDYALVIENNPQMSFALTLSAFWYYYAPGIGGGSKSRAREYFTQAYEYASNDYEKYYGCINLSQMKFEDKKKEEAIELLDQAEKILAGTRYISFIRTINRLGYSVFDYNQNSTRKKLDERLSQEN